MVELSTPTPRPPRSQQAPNTRDQTNAHPTTCPTDSTDSSDSTDNVRHHRSLSNDKRLREECPSKRYGP